jgi:hypothetical protein
MASGPPSLEPTIIIVDSDPDRVMYSDEIVAITADEEGTPFVYAYNIEATQDENTLGFNG